MARIQELSKSELVAYIKGQGAYDVRVADPHKGFEHSLPERHPLAIMPSCRSVVVFVMPCPVWINNTVLGLYAKEEKKSGRSVVGALRDAAWSPHHNMHVLKGVLAGHIWYSAAYYLNQRGYQVADFYTDRAKRPQDKLCAYEAGFGVYGHSGILLHPELGNRFAPGALLTDALLEPDGRLEGYAPCAKCGACVKICPGQAFDRTKTYPESFDPKKCHKARYAMSKEKLYCHECLRVCPAAKLKEADMAFLRRVGSVGEKARRTRNPDGTPGGPVVDDITPL